MGALAVSVAATAFWIATCVPTISGVSDGGGVAVTTMTMGVLELHPTKTMITMSAPMSREGNFNCRMFYLFVVLSA